MLSVLEISTMRVDITANDTNLSLDFLEDVQKVNSVSGPLAFTIHSCIQNLIIVGVNIAVIW